MCVRWFEETREEGTENTRHSSDFTISLTTATNQNIIKRPADLNNITQAVNVSNTGTSAKEHGSHSYNNNNSNDNSDYNNINTNYNSDLVSLSSLNEALNNFFGADFSKFVTEKILSLEVKHQGFVLSNFK